MKKIERVNYLEKLKGLRLTPDIKIITGLRRSGKSYLLFNLFALISLSLSVQSQQTVVFTLAPNEQEEESLLLLEEQSNQEDAVLLSHAVNRAKASGTTFNPDAYVPTTDTKYAMWMPLQDHFPDKIAYVSNGNTTELMLYSDGVQYSTKNEPRAGIVYQFFLHCKQEANWSGTFFLGIQPYEVGEFSGNVYYFQEDGDVRKYYITGGTITIVQRASLIDVWFGMTDNYGKYHQHYFWYPGYCTSSSNSSALMALNVEKALSEITFSPTGVRPVPIMVKGVVKEITNDYYFKLVLEDKKTLPCYDMLGHYGENDHYINHYYSNKSYFKEGDTVVVLAQKYNVLSEPQMRYGFIYKHYPYVNKNPKYTPKNVSASVFHNAVTLTWEPQDGYRWEVLSPSGKYDYTSSPSSQWYSNTSGAASGTYKIRAVDNDDNPLSDWVTCEYSIAEGFEYAIKNFDEYQDGTLHYISWKWDRIPDDCRIKISKVEYSDTKEISYLIEDFSVKSLFGTMSLNPTYHFRIDIPGTYYISVFPVLNNKEAAMLKTSFYHSGGTDYTPTDLNINIDKDQVKCSWSSSANRFKIRVYRHGSLVKEDITSSTSYTITGDKDGIYRFNVSAYNEYTESPASCGSRSVTSYTTTMHYHRFFPIREETEATKSKKDAIYFAGNSPANGYVFDTVYCTYKINKENILREGDPHTMLFAKFNSSWDNFDEWENGLRSQGRIVIPMQPKHMLGKFARKTTYLVEVRSGEGGSVITSTKYGWRFYHGGWYPGEEYTPVFTARASKGYRFSHWTDDAPERYNIDRKIRVFGFYNLTAIFSKIKEPETPDGKVAITVLTGSDEMGSVNDEVSGTYDVRTQVTITAKPKDNYVFDYWNDGENPADYIATRTITLTQDTTFIAHFAPDSVSITIKSNNEAYGTVNAEINGRYPKNTKLTLIATPTDTTSLVQWSTGQVSLTWTLQLTQDTVITAFFDLLKNINYTPYDLWAWRQPKEVTTNYGGHIWSGNISTGWSVQNRAPLYDVNLWYLFTNPETKKDDVAWADEWFVDSTAHQFLLNEDSIWTYSVQAGNWEEEYNEETNEYTSVWKPLSETVWYYYDYLHDKDGIQQPVFFTRVDTIIPRNMKVTTEDSCIYHFEWDIKYKTEPFTYAIDIFSKDYHLLKTDTVAGNKYSCAFSRKDSMAWRVKPLFQRTLTEYVDLTYQYGPKFRANPKCENLIPTNLQATYANDTLQLCWEGEAPNFLVDLIYAEDQPNEYSFSEYTDEHCIRFRVYDRGEYTWYVYPLDELYEDISDDFFYSTIKVDKTSRVQYELVVEDDGWCDVNSDEVNGMYEPYSVVTVVADIPVGNAFLGWSDGDLSNPRTIVMTKDFHIQVITKWGEEESVVTPTFTVKFYDWDDTLLKEQSVEKGSDATPPDNPKRAGYKFVGWDEDYTNVQKDLTIYALYKLQEEALGQITNDQLPITNKIIKDNQILILRGDKVYTVTGQEVR